MRPARRQSGFTLVEILVAMTIVLGILSMVYGTHSAITRSIDKSRQRSAVLLQGRNTLAGLARRIRCTYAVTAKPPMLLAGQELRRQTAGDQKGPNCFSGAMDNPSGEILRMVTTGGPDERNRQPRGLFAASYKYDRIAGLLSLGQWEFTGLMEKPAGQTFEPVADNVRQLEFQFLDGEKWLSNWSFTESRKLPDAVKIDLTLEDKDHRKYSFATTVAIACGGVKPNIQTEEFLAAVSR